jgi:hypothetical protein
MLAGMNQTKAQFAATLLPQLNGPNNGRNFHKIGSCTRDDVNHGTHDAA